MSDTSCKEAFGNSNASSRVRARVGATFNFVCGIATLLSLALGWICAEPAAKARAIDIICHPYLAVLEAYAYAASYFDGPKAAELLAAGERLYEAKDFSGSRARYDEAISKGLNTPELFLGRGDARYAMSDWTGSILDYTQAIKLRSDWGAAYIRRGNAYEQSGDIAAAISDYSTAITISPKDVVARRSRVKLYVASHLSAQAATDLAELVRIDSNQATDLNGLCWFQIALGQLKVALESCNRSLRIKPNVASTLDSRGYVFLKSGLIQAALSDFNNALKQEPNLASSLYGRGLAKILNADCTGHTDLQAAKGFLPDIEDDYWDKSHILQGLNKSMLSPSYCAQLRNRASVVPDVVSASSSEDEDCESRDQPPVLVTQRRSFQPRRISRRTCSGLFCLFFPNND